jgi:hypothetical protein
MKIELTDEFNTSESMKNLFLEIMQSVTDELKPQCEEVRLILVDKYKTTRDVVVKNSLNNILGIYDMGLSADPENAPWRSLATGKEISIFIKPKNLIDNDYTVERITEGFAHEISEYRVMKESCFYPLWIIQTCENIRWMRLYQFCAREKIADKFSAEHGFQHEIMTTASEKDIKRKVELSRPPKDNYQYFPSAVYWLLVFDKGFSLEMAGHTSLADTYLDYIIEGLKNTGSDVCRLLGNEYAEFRKRLVRDFDVLVLADEINIFRLRYGLDKIL